jgi:hypothetical protein
MCEVQSAGLNSEFPLPATRFRITAVIGYINCRFIFAVESAHFCPVLIPSEIGTDAGGLYDATTALSVRAVFCNVSSFQTDALLVKI